MSYPVNSLCTLTRIYAAKQECAMIHLIQFNVNGSHLPVARGSVILRRLCKLLLAGFCLKGCEPGRICFLLVLVINIVLAKWKYILRKTLSCLNLIAHNN